MLTTEIENPRQFTIVSAVAVFSLGAVLATNVENWGESAITRKPQTKRSRIKANSPTSNMNGDNVQQNPEPANARKATFALPFFAAR